MASAAGDARGAKHVDPAAGAGTGPGEGKVEEEKLSEEAYSENVKELMRFLEGKSDYVYERYDRPDPFLPFLREKTVAGLEEEIEDYGELTGMQKFEPGQLLVVAIVKTQDGPLAMVQDSTGKGYMVSPGVKLGKNGVIAAISDNMILVKQKKIMTSGAVRQHEVRMLLKREGE